LRCSSTCWCIWKAHVCAGSLRYTRGIHRCKIGERHLRRLALPCALGRTGGFIGNRRLAALVLSAQAVEYDVRTTTIPAKLIKIDCLPYSAFSDRLGGAGDALGTTMTT
jgi:hypothetical protein